MPTRRVRVAMFMSGVIVMHVGVPGHNPSSVKIAVQVNLFNPSLDSLVYTPARETDP